MPASVADFVADSATVTIPVGEDSTITAVYAPSKMNAAQNQKLMRYIENGDPLAAARIICEGITSWDLEGPLFGEFPVLDRDGQPTLDDLGDEVVERREIVSAGQVVPLKPDVLAHIPTGSLLALWQKIQEDMTPDPQTRRGRGSRRR